MKGSELTTWGLVVERVFVTVQELAEKLCRLGRLYYDDGTSNDVLVAIWTLSDHETSSRWQYENIYVDPKWFDEILDGSSHRETCLSVREDLRFPSTTRARFLKAFSKLSQARIASEYSMRERARDYALEALANITNPHAPYSVISVDRC